MSTFLLRVTCPCLSCFLNCERSPRIEQSPRYVTRNTHTVSSPAVQKTENSSAWNHTFKLQRRGPLRKTREVLSLWHTHGNAQKELIICPAECSLDGNVRSSTRKTKCPREKKNGGRRDASVCVYWDFWQQRLFVYGSALTGEGVMRSSTGTNRVGFAIWEKGSLGVFLI